MTSQLREIPLKDLQLHSANPRADAGDLSDLVASISELGVQEPILVVPQNGHFAIVAGSRRFEASKKAGKTSIPAIVREDLLPNDVATIALIENLQRKDLNALEEAKGYDRWLRITGKKQSELAQAVGRAPSTIANALRLLEAPDVVKEALRKGEITAAHARVALELKDPSLATSLELKAGVRVDDLKVQVDRVNEVSGLRGAVAVERAQKFLAKAREDHPKATITWEKQKPFRYAREVVDLVKALGKPPAPVVGPVGKNRYVGMGTAPTPERHDKICSCRAYCIEASQDYRSNLGSGGLKLELERVCIDKAGYAKARPKVKTNRVTGAKRKAPSAPKPISPEQQAKIDAKQRQQDETRVAEVFTALPKAGKPKYAPLYKRIRKGQMPADAARALLYMETAGDAGSLNNDRERAIAWDRIQKMPAKKASELALATIASRLEQEAGFGFRDDEVQDRVLAHFGLKVEQPKAKKAKR